MDYTTPGYRGWQGIGPKRLTLGYAKELVTPLGFTLRKNGWGDYTLRDKVSGETYHTASDRPEDLQDAVGTAREWAAGTFVQVTIRREVAP